MASIISWNPSSTRLEIEISSSRVKSGTVPISRVYIVMGSEVRETSLSTNDKTSSSS